MKKTIIKYVIIETFPRVLLTKNIFLNLIIGIYYYTLLLFISLKNVIKYKTNILAKKKNVYNSEDKTEILKENKIDIKSNINKIKIEQNKENIESFASYNEEFFYNKKAIIELKKNYDNIKDASINFDLISFLPDLSNFILKKYTINYLIKNDNNEETIEYMILLELNEVSVRIISQINYLKNKFNYKKEI